MRVHVLGDGVLADTTRTCCQRHFDLTDRDPDVLWVCLEPFHQDWEPVPLTVISSPILVGTCAALEKRYPDCSFVVAPENIRYASPVDDFLHQTRIVVGGEPDPRISALFAPFCDNILWMSPESAEMTKHALNTYLAMCVRFGNELGALCEEYGADNTDVVTALLTERRVSSYAPINPGPPPSPHLLREVGNMVRLGAGPLIQALA